MVGIKDFEMPKACYVCPISDEWTGICPIVGSEQIDKDTGRQVNCPLIEVEPQESGVKA